MRHVRRIGRGLAGVLGLLAGCGDAGEPEARPATVEREPERAEPAAAALAGDPLLLRARQGIREGALPTELEAQVLGSSRPEHARARRVLRAMAEPPGAGDRGEGSDEGDEGEGRLRPPPILPPADPSRVPGAPEPAAASATKPERSSKGSEPSGRRPPSSRGSASRGSTSLGTLSLRSTSKGATLVIPAPSSLVVGVANQPRSGLVRLVIESAKAGGGVLSARPKTEGAEVTGVRQGQDTVQITLRLDPGWTLGSVQPFSGGAKVHLRAPPGP